MKKINLKFNENIKEFFKEDNNLNEIYNETKFNFIYVNKLNTSNFLNFSKKEIDKKKEILYVNLYNLLDKETGIIAIQCENSELNKTVNILNKIFEKNNYIGKYTRTKNKIFNNYFPIDNNNDYILIYSRNKNKIKEIIQKKFVVNKEKIIEIFEENNLLLKKLFEKNNSNEEKNNKYPYFYKNENGKWKFSYKKKDYFYILEENENESKNKFVKEIINFFNYDNPYINFDNLLPEYTNELEIVEILNDFNIYKKEYLKNLLFNLDKYKKYIEETPYSLYYKIFKDFELKENYKILNFGTKLGGVVKGSIKYLENNSINNLSIELVLNSNKYEEEKEENKNNKSLKIFTSKEKMLNYKLFINKRYKKYKGNINLNWN